MPSKSRRDAAMEVLETRYPGKKSFATKMQSFYADNPASGRYGTQKWLTFIRAAGAVGTTHADADLDYWTRVAVVPTTYVLEPTANGGRVLSDSSSSYAVARNGTGNKYLFQGVWAEIGQGLSDSGEPDFIPSWSCFEAFYEFDTSALVGVINTATLSLVIEENYFYTSATVEARLKDFGASLEIADFVPGADIAALPLLASRLYAITDPVQVRHNLTNAGNALKDNINRAGFTRMMLSSDRLRLGTTPVETEVGYIAYTGLQPGRKPRLTIEMAL